MGAKKFAKNSMKQDALKAPANPDSATGSPLKEKLIKELRSEAPLKPLVEMPPKLSPEEAEKEAEEAKEEAEKEDREQVSVLRKISSMLRERAKLNESRKAEEELKEKIGKAEEKVRTKPAITAEEAKKGIFRSVLQLLSPQKAVKEGVSKVSLKPEHRRLQKKSSKEKFKVTKFNYGPAHKKLEKLKEDEKRIRLERNKREEKRQLENVEAEETAILEIYRLLEKLAVAAAYGRAEEAKKLYALAQKKFGALSEHGKAQAKPVIERAMASINSLGVRRAPQASRSGRQ